MLDLQYLLVIPAFFIGGFGRRVAGGLVQDIIHQRTGDLGIRLFYGFTIGLCAMFVGVGYLWALLLALLTYVGTTTGNFNSMGMGRQSDGTINHAQWIRHYLGMTAHGLLSTLLPAAWMAAYALSGGDWHQLLTHGFWHHLAFVPGVIPILVSGLLFPWCYELGYRITGYAPDRGWRLKGWPLWLYVAPEFGELFLGGVVAIGTLVAVWVG